MVLEDEEGVELFVVLPPPRPEDPSLCKEPGATPAPSGLGSSPVSVCPDTHLEQTVPVGVYVCLYIATCTLCVCVCVRVCACDLFKSKTCTKTIWLNLSLRSEA